MKSNSIASDSIDLSPKKNLNMKTILSKDGSKAISLRISPNQAQRKQFRKKDSNEEIFNFNNENPYLDSVDIDLVNEEPSDQNPRSLRNAKTMDVPEPNLNRNNASEPLFDSMLFD